MNYNDMKAIAHQITDSDDNYDTHRDLFYDPVKKIFIHKPTVKKTTRIALTCINGKSTQAWISNACIYIGRYECIVNPDWIMEDMQSV